MTLTVYRLKISLCHVRPDVWRQIEVPADIKLNKLHSILQTAMGWSDTHLHAFRIGDAVYSAPDPENSGTAMNERNVRLNQVVSQGSEFNYEYDFGDGWEHEILVENEFSADPAIHYPRCIAGARACPPEDCGGPPGYEDVLSALTDPRHERHEEFIDWSPTGFDPEVFELEDVNRKLWRLR